MSDTTFDLGTSKQVPLTVLATDAGGAMVPGVVPVVTSSDETVVTIGTDVDGTTLAIRATLASGTARVSAVVTNADGTSATGVLTLTLAAVTTSAANVANVEIVPGIPS